MLFAQSGKGGVKITLEVAGSQIPMEVGTGATVTVIPISVYEQYLSHVQLHASTVSLKTYSGGSLKVKGEAIVPVRYGEQHATAKIIVVDVRGKPAILGRNWLSKIQLDWGSLFSVEARQMFDPKEKLSRLFGRGVSTVQGHEARITLTAEANPRFHRSRPVPYALQEKVNQELDRMQCEGVIRPVEKSDWATPVVVIRKGEGTVRLCGDYKVTINPYLDMGGYPMPNPQDLLATLAGGRRFPLMDLKQAYQQMCVASGSQHYLTINTNKGLFMFNRMPFGVCSAPGIWQRTMDNLLSEIPGVICYLDDILVNGENEKQHEQRLLTVLRRLDKAGMRLKQGKCEFNQPQVEYLGHIISGQGISPSDTKAQAIRDAPERTNVTELKAFLGLFNYCGRFLPKLSATLHLFYALLGKNRSWKWRSKEREAFQKGKQKLMESKFLTHYDLQRPVSLSCDASPYGVGDCLTHIMPDGEERPIAFAYRTLSTAEKKYAHL